MWVLRFHRLRTTGPKSLQWHAKIHFNVFALMWILSSDHFLGEKHARRSCLQGVQLKAGTIWDPGPALKIGSTRQRSAGVSFKKGKKTKQTKKEIWRDFLPPNVSDSPIKTSPRRAQRRPGLQMRSAEIERVEIRRKSHHTQSSAKKEQSLHLPCWWEACRWRARRSTCWRIWRGTKRPCAQPGNTGGWREWGLKAFWRPSGGTEKQMFEEVQGKEGGKKASVSDSRYYGLLNEKKKKVSANNNRRGEKKETISSEVGRQRVGKNMCDISVSPCVASDESFPVSKVLSGSRCTAAQTRLQYLYSEPRTELLSQTYEQFPLGAAHSWQIWELCCESGRLAAQTPLAFASSSHTLLLAGGLRPC